MLLTFLLNIGSAMNNPAWQAIVPELVPREELPDAIALNSAAFNLARAVGPCFGRPGCGRFPVAPVRRGRRLSSQFRLVPGSDFRPVRLEADSAFQERASCRADLRFHAERRSLRAPLAGGHRDPVARVLFTGFASAVWALLAVVARQDLQAGVMAYGLLNGCLGAGAVIGAALLPRLRRMCRPRWLLAGAGVIFSGTLADACRQPAASP